MVKERNGGFLGGARPKNRDGAVEPALAEAGVPDEEIETFVGDATAGDFATCFEPCTSGLR